VGIRRRVPILIPLQLPNKAAAKTMAHPSAGRRKRTLRRRPIFSHPGSVTHAGDLRKNRMTSKNKRSSQATAVNVMTKATVSKGTKRKNARTMEAMTTPGIAAI